ncbi:MAG: VOC family protein [Acidimicrobiia bacterium]|nr:VOC family protein [Acidimicrobiia bacterium]MYG57181.1 VOC family protein [Acidimicrobiia bacterium]MYJ31403.1 VOC family protein [Acidimicrobiia bacterium]
MSDVQPIPDDYPRVTPYLCVDGAAAAIDFMVEVFDATERMRISAPGGMIGHAEVAIGDSIIMVSDEYPEMGVIGPKKIGGTAVTVMVYVEDADATFAKAVAAGATAERPVETHFYGDRGGQFTDPFGHRWNVSTHVEDVAHDELARRSAEMFGE